MRQATIVALLLVLAGFGACATTPDEPTFDNPFDPNGTNPGEGYGLTVEASGQAVVLIWDNIPGMTGYKVEWSDDAGSPQTWVIRNEFYEPTGGAPKVVFEDLMFTAEKTNWYRVTGYVDTDGDTEPPATPSTPVAVDIDVLVSPEGGALTTSTRSIDVEVLTGVADSIEFSNYPDFTGSETFEVTPGSWDQVTWELLGDPEDGVENRADLVVHYRTRTATSIGQAGSFSIQVLFTPSLQVERGLRAGPGGYYMVDTKQFFTLVGVADASLDSVVRNHFVDGDTLRVEELPVASVSDTIKVTWDPDLEEEYVDGEVVASLTSAFGFSENARITLRLPGPIGDPSIEVVGGSVTTTPEIEVMLTAENAGYYILSELPDFSGAKWTPWTDLAEYTLAQTPPTGFLYAAFRNPILIEDDTRVTSALVSLVSPPARVRH